MPAAGESMQPKVPVLLPVLPVWEEWALLFVDTGAHKSVVGRSGVGEEWGWGRGLEKYARLEASDARGGQGACRIRISNQQILMRSPLTSLLFQFSLPLPHGVIEACPAPFGV